MQDNNTNADTDRSRSFRSGDAQLPSYLSVPVPVHTTRDARHPITASYQTTRIRGKESERLTLPSLALRRR